MQAYMSDTWVILQVLARAPQTCIRRLFGCTICVVCGACLLATTLPDCSCCL